MGIITAVLKKLLPTTYNLLSKMGAEAKDRASFILEEYAKSNGNNSGGEKNSNDDSLYEDFIFLGFVNSP